MYEKPDQSKLRNSTLISGIILLAVSFAQITIDSSKSITFLGIPLIVENTSVIAYSITGIAIYYLFRYWFYSMRQLSPWSKRSDFFREFISDDDGYYRKELATRDDVLDRISYVKHGTIDFDVNGSYKKDDGKWELWYLNPKKYSFITFIKDLDYLLPPLVNVVAVISAIINLIL